MTDLGPLTEQIGKDKNKNPKEEFAQIIKALISIQGRLKGFKFETGSRFKESAIDGYVNKNYPGIECPAIFQFKWLKSPINKPPYDQQIKNSFKQALDSPIKFKSFVLVTPHDLSEGEKAWLNGFERDYSIRVYHIGHRIVIRLMKNSPALQNYVYSASEPGEEHFNIIYRKYVNSVAYELKYLEFIGLPTGQYQRQELLRRTELEKVYIPITFEKEAGGSLKLQLHHIINSSIRCVIQGNPGSGKSTLAKYLALIFSKEHYTAEDEEFEIEQKVPLIIPIRDFARFHPTGEIESFDFIDYLAYTADKHYRIQGINKDFFIAMLELGRAIVLFDGLDEVTDIHRKTEIARVIKEFSKDYMDNSIWVTSRIFGYTNDIRLLMSEFNHYYLGEVSDSQAYTFIGEWYKIQIPLRKDERENKINSLKRAIKENEGVKRLQKNPLLLTMMTLVHQFEGTLPDDRGKLYEKCIELLLKTWQEQKYITQGEENPLEKRKIRYDEQLRLLAAVAFHIQKKNEYTNDDLVRGLIGEQELEEVLFNARYDERRLSKERAKKDVETFIEYLRDRVGLFVETGKYEKTKENAFSFIHLSFLEYLCAYQLSEDKSKSQVEHIAGLINYIKIPSWEEIALLALYIFSKSPGGNHFIDRFALEAFKILKETEMPECWHLLGRAVRDNISFALEDMSTIIKKLLDLWVSEPGVEFPIIIFKEIVDFSLEGREYLKVTLAENIKKECAPAAFASLFLYLKWFALDEGIIIAINENPGKLRLYPYLPFFRNDESVSRFLYDNLGTEHWNAYYNSTRDIPGRNLNDIILYRTNEQELTGYIISSWSKIFSAIQERKLFLEINQEAAKEKQYIGILNIDFSYALAEFPLNLFEHFLDTLLAYLDSPENINAFQITNDQIFKSQKNSIKDQPEQLYIRKWIEDLLDRHFNDLKKNIPSGYKFSSDESQHLNDIVREFSWEFSQYLANDLISYLNGKFSEDLSVFFSHNTGQQDFTNYFKRDFYHYLSQDYKRDDSFYISKSFSRFLNQKFSQNFSENFIRYFQEYFTEEIFADFFENYSRKFTSEFKKSIEISYEKDFNKPLYWDDSTNMNLIQIYECFSNRFVEHDMAFINDFFHHLYTFLFFNKVKILFLDSGKIGQARTHKQNEALESRKIKIKKPFIVPFVFDFLLTCAFNHYIIKILAHLRVRFIGTTPDRKMIREAIENFCQDYPFQNYIIREAWYIYASEFDKKTQPQSPLNNLRLACFITNAAKISILTDMPCMGSQWDIILQRAETSDDIFVQAALTLYKMATFENKKKNSPQVYFKMKEFEKQYPEYFEMIGFRKGVKNEEEIIN